LASISIPEEDEFLMFFFAYRFSLWLDVVRVLDVDNDWGG
jgi:hypothetical protein